MIPLKYGRPAVLLSACQKSFTGLMRFFCLFISVGLYLALIWSPADYQQGETVRIMYVHVPSSWGALGIYTLMAIVSAAGLIKRLSVCHLMTQAAAPVGFTLCVISLITGSIWGQPTWGTWWVWDARLTSMLLLAFLYGGFMMVYSGSQNQERKEKSAAFIALIGWINVPIIKWSVDWWTTLHQPASIMRFAKPAIHWTMMLPLFTMALALACLSLAIIALRLQTLVLERQDKAQYLRHLAQEEPQS